MGPNNPTLDAMLVSGQLLQVRFQAWGAAYMCIPLTFVASKWRHRIMGLGWNRALFRWRRRSYCASVSAVDRSFFGSLSLDLYFHPPTCTFGFDDPPTSNLPDAPLTRLYYSTYLEPGHSAATDFITHSSLAKLICVVGGFESLTYLFRRGS